MNKLRAYILSISAFRVFRAVGVHLESSHVTFPALHLSLYQKIEAESDVKEKRLTM